MCPYPYPCVRAAAAVRDLSTGGTTCRAAPQPPPPSPSPPPPSSATAVNTTLADSVCDAAASRFKFYDSSTWLTMSRTLNGVYSTFVNEFQDAAYPAGSPTGRYIDPSGDYDVVRGNALVYPGKCPFISSESCAFCLTFGPGVSARAQTDTDGLILKNTARGGYGLMGSWNGPLLRITNSPAQPEPGGWAADTPTRGFTISVSYRVDAAPSAPGAAVFYLRTSLNSCVNTTTAAGAGAAFPGAAPTPRCDPYLGLVQMAAGAGFSAAFLPIAGQTFPATNATVRSILRCARHVLCCVCQFILQLVPILSNPRFSYAGGGQRGPGHPPAGQVGPIHHRGHPGQPDASVQQHAGGARRRRCVGQQAQAHPVSSYPLSTDC